ncbi:MAG: ParB N-terminal domain-containing protein [Candidatus Bathyarchaeia archaeon]
MTNNAAMPSKMPRLCWLKVEDVRIPEGRLRSHFDDQDDFNESVRANGVIQPIHVCEDKSGVYWLADGQNRLEALKSQGKTMIQAYVVKGSKQDAILHSAKLNVLRGKVNVGELAEFLLNLRKDMKVEEIAESLRLSKGYVSKLLSIAQNKPVLEKLKAGLISYKEAYNEVSCKSPEEVQSFPGKQESQETIHKAESLTVKQEFEETRQPLTDEDLGITTNLKRALEEGKRFKPLGPDDLKPEESRKTEYMTCDYCGKILSRLDVKWIKVHAEEYDKVLLLIKGEAERETRNESFQP